MHILCLHQFYGSPDGPGNSRHWTFFKHLSKNHKITLICNRKHTKSSLKEVYGFVPEGVTVHYVDVPYENEMDNGGRLKAYLHFAKQAFLIGRKIKNVDVVWGVTVPLTTAFVGILLAKWKKVKCLVEIKDLWPDFPIQMGALQNPIAQKLAYAMEKYVYQKASHIICTSPDYKTHILSIAPHQKVDTLYLGTNFDFIDSIDTERIASLRKQYNLEGKKVILYGGTFGRANAIPELLAVVNAAQEYPEMQFVFFGVGFYQKEVLESAKILSNLTVLPAQSYQESLSWFKLADIGLISFIDIPVLSTNSPAKFFDSLGCATPVIITNDGWTRLFVENNECGIYISLDNSTQFIATLNAWINQPNFTVYAQNAEKASRLAFDLTHIVKNLDTIFNTLT